MGCSVLTGRWEVDAGRLIGGESGGSRLTEGEDGAPPICTPPEAADLELITAAVNAFHLHPAEVGFELLDGRGRPVALLVPASS